jgi:23S rRNA maturation-related 3'-5' exoribonuclease YhaM
MEYFVKVDQTLEDHKYGYPSLNRDAKYASAISCRSKACSGLTPPEPVRCMEDSIRNYHKFSARLH